MRKTDLQFSLPSFDELKSSAFNPPSPSGQKQAAREMNVIRAAVPARRLKVAAYCRVSTDKEDQKSSIRIQKEHFSSVAAQHEDWLFVGVYADIVSGTKKEKRPQLQRLLADCAAGRVNLVLTKSVSRFARNTTDLLEMVRSLTAKGTDISFERENIDTRTMDSEFLLTILASLAEDESHSISANCRWGLQKRFENGTYGKYTPRPCTLKTEESPVLLSCEMINPEEFAKNPNSKFILHFASENNDQIYLRTYTYPTYFKDQALKNVGVIHGKILDREEEDDYIHNQYVSAKLEFTLEDRILNSTWKGLKDSKKKALKSAQIQWINDKTSKCGTPKDGMSENELINVYRCQFNYTRERSEFLVNQY